MIRGICDYADSHKNKHWQGFAALVVPDPAYDLRPSNCFLDLRRDLQQWSENKTTGGHEVQGKNKNKIFALPLMFHVSSFRARTDYIPTSLLTILMYSVGRHLGKDANDGSAGENFPQLEHTQPLENVVVDVNGTTRKPRVSSWWLSLMTIFQPPAAGFQRISYTCVGSVLLQSRISHLHLF